MKDKFKMAPPAMQKQAVIRGLIALGSLLLSIIGLQTGCSTSLAVLALGIVLFFYLNFALFLSRVIDGDYMSVQGVCSDIERSFVKKRLRSVTLDLGSQKLKVMVNGKPPRAKVGDMITVYLSPKTTVYGDGEILMICNYHAIQVN